MSDQVNDVDTSQAEVDRDFNQGLNEFGINLDENFSTGGTDAGSSQEPGPEPKPEISAAQARKLMEKGIFMFFNMIDSRFCPGYQIHKDEELMMAEVVTEAIEYHFPGVTLGPALTAIGTIGVVYGSRFAEGVPARMKDVNQQPEASTDDPLNSAAGAVHE